MECCKCISATSSLLTLMLLTAKLASPKSCKNPEKPLKPLANGYSSESAQQELSNEYQHDRVLMVLKNLCILVLWAKVATALEGLSIETAGICLPLQ